MKRTLFLASACALIAACTGETTADADGDGEISSEEIAAAVEGETIKPQPGQYRTTVTLVDVEMPDAPPEMIEAMKKGRGAQTDEMCMTQEDADKGFEEIAKGPPGNDCKTNSFSADGGKIAAEMTCAAPGDTELRMTVSGTGTETSMDMTMTMEGETPMGKGKMVMKMESERIGDCPA